MELCSFSGYKIHPGHGRRLIRVDGTASSLAAGERVPEGKRGQQGTGLATGNRRQQEDCRKPWGQTLRVCVCVLSVML